MAGTPRGKAHTPEEMDAKRALVRLQRMVRGPVTPAAVEHRLRTQGGYVGQDEAVATLSLGMALHGRRILERVHHDADPLTLPRLSHLVIGPSGSGKSFLVQRLAACGLGGDPVPFVRIDMTGVTEAGYYGLDLPTVAAGGAIAAAGGDKGVAEGSAVLFCDELCKLRSSGNPNHREVGGQQAQAAMLDLVDGQAMTADLYDRGPDGRNLRTTICFDTRCLWVVAAGAFSGLDQIVVERLRGRRRMGFAGGAEKPLEAALRKADVLRETTTEDLVRFGMLPELCGRFLSVVVLAPLRAADYRGILDQRLPGAPVPQWRRAAEVLGFELRMTDGLLDALAAAAEAEGLGARSLRSLVARVCRRAMCEVPERSRSRMSAGVYARCTLDASALEDGSYRLSWPKRTKEQVWGEAGWSDETGADDEVGEAEPGTAAG